ncbi:MAG: response regulator transcription factor [Bacteroidota bacterium]
MYNILLVEDEPSMQMGLRDNLEFEGYQVAVAGDGVEGLDQLMKGKFDLVLLDVMMPRMSGFDVCRKAREGGVETPIILLTAKGEEIDKVLGLELGADDYITKPFSLRELLARVKAVLRRAGPTQASDPDERTIGRLTVNFQSYQARIGEEQVKMSHREVEILRYLCKHLNEIVSRADLLQEIWGYDAHPTTRTVDNFVLKLRQKIEEDPNQPKHILTVHGVGYKLLG